MTYILYRIAIGYSDDYSFAIEGTTKDKSVADAYKAKSARCSDRYDYVETGELTLEDIKTNHK